MTINDISIGDTVQFIYDGGSHPGMIRTVDVVHITPSYIEGYDYFVSADRKFSISKIKNLQFSKNQYGIKCKITNDPVVTNCYHLEFTNGSDNRKLLVNALNNVYHNNYCIQNWYDLSDVFA